LGQLAFNFCEPFVQIFVFLVPYYEADNVFAGQPPQPLVLHVEQSNKGLDHFGQALGEYAERLSRHRVPLPVKLGLELQRFEPLVKGLSADIRFLYGIVSRIRG